MGDDVCGQSSLDVKTAFDLAKPRYYCQHFQGRSARVDYCGAVAGDGELAGKSNLRVLRDRSRSRIRQGSVEAPTLSDAGEAHLVERGEGHLEGPDCGLEEKGTGDTSSAACCGQTTFGS